VRAGAEAGAEAEAARTPRDSAVRIVRELMTRPTGTETASAWVVVRKER
jgi:hypothetical protein